MATEMVVIHTLQADECSLIGIFIFWLESSTVKAKKLERFRVKRIRGVRRIRSCWRVDKHFQTERENPNTRTQNLYSTAPLNPEITTYKFLPNWLSALLLHLVSLPRLSLSLPPVYLLLLLSFITPSALWPKLIRGWINDEMSEGVFGCVYVLDVSERKCVHVSAQCDKCLCACAFLPHYGEILWLCHLTCAA